MVSTERDSTSNSLYAVVEFEAEWVDVRSGSKTTRVR